MRTWLIGAFEQPTTTGQKILWGALILLIVASVVEMAVTAHYPEVGATIARVVGPFDMIILVVFSIEYVVRLIVLPNRWSYAFSVSGLVDLLAILPTLIAYMLAVPAETTWLRIFRIMRFVRALKEINRGGAATLGTGIFGRVAPWMLVAVACKSLVLYLESFEWWPTLPNLSVMLGVIGFAVSVLLGAKLSAAQGRLYAFEENIATVVGGLRLALAGGAAPSAVFSWARSFRVALEQSKDDPSAFRAETAAFTQTVLLKTVQPPMMANVQIALERVMHRLVARTPPAYNKFLANVGLIYAGTVLLAIPGLAGLAGAALVIYVIGGIIVVVEAMDSPVGGEDDLIGANLYPLSSFLAEGEQITHAEAVDNAACDVAYRHPELTNLRG